MSINGPTPVNRPGITLKPGPVSLGPPTPDMVHRSNPGGTIMRIDPIGPIVDPRLPVTRSNDRRQDRRERRRDRRNGATDYQPILGS